MLLSNAGASGGELWDGTVTLPTSTSVGLVSGGSIRRTRIRVEFRNPDGGLAFCGNGSRCAARFAYLRGLAGPRMVLETALGSVPAEVVDDRVRLTLPQPVDEGPVTLELAGERLTGHRVTAGVPHFVIFVPDVNDAPLERWGPGARRHPIFGTAGVNVDLVAESDDTLHVRTWERGVEAETLACGSGAVAAAFAWHRRGGAAHCRLVPRSGVLLHVRFEGASGSADGVILEGDARLVFEASLGPDAVTGFPADPRHA